jgi:RNA polymerase sigma-70 factor (ECF subfamily)
MPLISKSSTPYASWTDDALVEALTQGDERAFAELYERYWYQLFDLAYRKTRSREDAEEIVQELFAALWQKRDAIAIQTAKTYLYSAVKHRIIDLIRSRMTHAGYVDYSQLHLSAIDHSTEKTVAADDLSLALMMGMTSLPEHTREVFRLSRFEHQSVPEIAERLNISHKTVEYHLTRALKQLRVSLREFLVMLLVLLLTK